MFPPKQAGPGTPAQGEVEVQVVCSFDEGPDLVEVHPGPVKTLARMREKLHEYLPPDPRGIWPLAANVLDPVRASVVAYGPNRVRQVLAPIPPV